MAFIERHARCSGVTLTPGGTRVNDGLFRLGRLRGGLGDLGAGELGWLLMLGDLGRSGRGRRGKGRSRDHAERGKGCNQTAIHVLCLRE
jgi:hypothetical protein